MTYHCCVLGVRVATMNGATNGVAVTNRWQRLVAVFGLVASVSLALFPPWQHQVQDWAGITKHGRAYLFHDQAFKIDWSRLALEQGIVWVPTLVLVLILRGVRGKPSVE